LRRRGREKDFHDAERLVKRLVAHELILNFVPDVEQRLWWTVVRTKSTTSSMRRALAPADRRPG